MIFRSAYFFLLVGIVCHATLTHASPLVQDTLVQEPLFADARRLSDDELSKVRGRYVSKDAFLYLGLQMLTQWQTPDDVYVAGMSMQIDLGKTFVPTITYVYSAASDPDSTTQQGGTDMPASAQNGGIKTITGAAQTITVAGYGNRINNELAIDVCPNKCQGINNTVAGNGTLLESGGGSTTVLNGGGMTTTFSSENGQIGMVLRNDQGQVLQQITQGRGILQSVDINSDKNHIQNLHLINIGLRPGTNLNAGGGGIGSMLDRVRALNP